MLDRAYGFSSIFRKEDVSQDKRPFSRRVILTVFRGQERLLTKAFDQGPVIIGRQPGCDLILEFPFISRTHCQIVEEGGNFFLRDLNSRNGLFVNAKKTDQYGLFDGLTFSLDELRIEIKMLNAAQVAMSSNQDSIETVVMRRPRGGNR